MLLNCMVVSPTMENPETRGELWDGKMYVFDDRISVEINHVDKKLLGKIGLMEHLANAILTVQTQNVIVKS